MSNQAVYLDYTNVSFAFFKLPQFLVTDSRFWEMSSDAKVVYCVMLNRLPLSIQNGWQNNGLYYIYFSMETVMELLHCSKSKAVRVMKELKLFKLIEGSRCEDHRRMRYFFRSDSGFVTQTGITDEPEQETGVILESCAGVISVPEQATGVTSEPDWSEMDTCTGVISESAQVSKPDRKKNNQKKTDSEKDHLHQEPAPFAQTKRRWRWSKQEIVDDLNSLWERDTMYTGSEQVRLDRLVQTCASVLSQRDWFRISGNQVSCEDVHRRLLGLDYEEVGYALDYLASCHSQCSSPAAYAIAVLYNAPDEAASYWDRKVANDLYSDRRQWSVA